MEGRGSQLPNAYGFTFLRVVVGKIFRPFYSFNLK
jgi:hypothetical protein